MPNTKIRLGVVAACFALLLAPDVQGSGCPGSPGQSQGPDVMITDITGPENYSAVGLVEALTLGSDACNLGDEEAEWVACPATTHPVFGGNLYKWSTVAGATRFEQVGQSWLKHGLGAEQSASCCANCQSSGTSQRLGIGCSDPYFAAQGGTQFILGPKSMVNAHTGIFSSEMCNTHPSGGNAGRLEVEIADLVATAGGTGADVRYFCQFQYVTADDAAAHNQNNNASSREMSVSGGGTAWHFAFPLISATQPETPAIRMWKLIDSGVVETDIETPEDDGFPGLVILAAKATDLGNGYWHYEYAVNNLNSDRSIGSFSVPCSPYASVQNIGFRDVSYRGGDGIGGVNHDGTDWPGTFADGAVSWATTPFASNNNANAIRWGTLYNFRFDANLPPSAGDVTLQEFKVVLDLVAPTVVPTPVSCVKGDVNGDNQIDGGDIAMFAQIQVGGEGTPEQKCAADVHVVPVGSVDEMDIGPFVDCLINSGCP